MNSLLTKVMAKPICLSAKCTWGVGVSQNTREGLKWIREGANQASDAAVSCQSYLGRLYFNGLKELGIDKDIATAMKWFEAAASGGSAEYQVKVGDFYLYGIEGELDKDFAKALSWFKRAANAVGSANEEYKADAMQGIAVIYDAGLGVPQSHYKAAQKHRQVYKMRNPYRLSPQFKVAEFALNGVGMEKDYKMASLWYYYASENENRDGAGEILKELASQGVYEAQYSLAFYYYDGEDNTKRRMEYSGMTEENKKAEQWFIKAARNGHLKSQRALGQFYTQHENYGNAFYWYKRAAEQGDADSQFILGEMYYSGKVGDGVELYEASRWFAKAAKQGHKRAKVKYREVDLNIYGQSGHWGWEYISESTEGSQLFINTQSISYNHNSRFPYVVAKVSYYPPQKTKRGDSYDTYLSDYFVNCRSRKIQGISVKYLRRGKALTHYANGEKTDINYLNYSEGIDDDGWETIKTNTFREHIYEEACN